MQGNALTFGEITRTLMACGQEGINQQEQLYFQALATANRFESAGDRLTIWYDDGQRMLNWMKSSTSFTITPTPPATMEPAGTSTPSANPSNPASERIQFATGATSATQTGHLQASGSDQYELSASGGQTMTVDLSFSVGQAILVVWGKDGTVLLSDHTEGPYFQGVLPSIQDYYFLVRDRPDGETVYRMEVTILPIGQK